MEKIVCLVQNGFHTSASIQSEIKVISLRQVQRYLTYAVNSGMIERPFRDFYIIPNATAISFNEFVENVSLNKEQNNTEHNETDTSLERSLSLILSKACLEISEDDRSVARRLLSSANWRKIKPDTVAEYVRETWERFEQSSAKYGDGIKNGVAYWFGILRRVLSNSLSEMRRAYRTFIENSGESAETSIETTEIQESETDSIDPVWEPVKTAIVEAVEAHSLFDVPQSTIKRTVGQIKRFAKHPDSVIVAIRHMITHDERGTFFFVRNLSNFERVRECIEKNFDRMLANKKKQSTEPVAETVSAKQTVQYDERYENFYKLFPTI
ncbi:hypothetical protein QB910_000106 [Dabrowskivirus KKP3916]|uniref:Uncharacterized protein n=1 Tax=Alicyclobacillus phage KKP_3916 TaxID=3040651 RepID=A0AAT9V7P2_9CAUD|nr:hypothetical protein QB910_000106 [Alicyclobacillus phage KKP 3916]